MTRAAFTPVAEAFLEEFIEDVEFLDILFFLRLERGRYRDAVDVARATGIEPIRASHHLVRLSLHGLIERAPRTSSLGGYRYLPRPRKERCLGEIEGVFAASRMEVIEHVLRRQRRQLGSFADAFRGEPR